MELQKFCRDTESFEIYEDYKKQAHRFLVDLGFSEENLKFHDHDKLAFYAKAACDIFYKFPMGWSELNGIHHRSTHDLSRHQEFSGKSMQYLDPVTNEKFTPTVIEYSIGADRLMLAVLTEAYNEETLEGGETRVVLKLHPAIAPYKVAILPLQKNINEKALELYRQLSSKFMCMYDEAGSIGKRYRRQDEIGVPYCVTIDFDTLEDNTVTIRDRDTMEQIRLPMADVEKYIEERIQFN
jgi:glycyl-tRNA synthetase